MRINSPNKVAGLVHEIEQFFDAEPDLTPAQRADAVLMVLETIRQRVEQKNRAAGGGKD